MKMVREVYEGLPEGYSIKAYAKYTYDSWEREYVVDTKVVLLYGEEEIAVEKDSVLKPRIRTYFIFFKKKPKMTWREKCEQWISVDIEYLTKYARDLERRKEVTDGLFDSLDGLEAEE